MSGKPNLISLGVQRYMAGLDINKIQEEFDSVFAYLFLKNDNNTLTWQTFCNEKREGHQDLAELSKLISSICELVPDRHILSTSEIRRLVNSSMTLTKQLTNLTDCDIPLETHPR